MMVSAGFTAALDGKKLPSTTYRLSTSWALPKKLGYQSNPQHCPAELSCYIEERIAELDFA